VNKVGVQAVLILRLSVCRRMPNSSKDCICWRYC